MKKKILSIFMCLCMFASLLSMTALAATQFTDVNDGDYFAAPVEWAVAQGITNGTSATTFSPDDTCTKAQILTFLWRAAGSPEIEHPYSPFADVNESHYYFMACVWAYKKGMLNVMSDYFEADAPCTRASKVKYLWKYAGRPDAASVPFSDVSGSSDMAKAVYWAVGYGVTNGTSNTTFSPDNTCTRGQIVTFLHRYFVQPLDTSDISIAGPHMDDSFVFVVETPELPEADAPSSGDSSASADAADPESIPESELDPLPPKDVTKQPDWYGSLTDRTKMSNARLMAEYWNLEDLIKSDDSYRTEPVLIRESDLELEINRRLRIVESYEEYSPDTWRDEYEELVAQYGDPAPLKEWYSGRG